MLLSATLVAILVTGVEAVSRDGRDNLFVPLAACLILKRISSKPPFEILYQNVSLLLLIAVMAAFAWRSRAFNVGGTLTAILFCYASWSLGSEIWAVPVFLATVGFIAVRRGAEVELVRTGIAVSALLLPFCILLVANATDHYAFWFGPFVMAVVATLCYAQLKLARGSALGWAAAAWGIVAVPTWYLQATSSPTLLLSMLVVSLTSALVVAKQDTRTPATRQLFIAAAVTAIVALELIGLDRWQPRTESLAMVGEVSVISPPF